MKTGQIFRDSVLDILVADLTWTVRVTRSSFSVADHADVIHQDQRHDHDTLTWLEFTTAKS